MKKLILACALILVGPASMGLAHATQTPLETRAGYLAIENSIDLSKVSPTVQFNLPKLLLRALAAEAIQEQPELVQAINGVEMMRLMVFEDNGGEELKKSMNKLLGELRTSWHPVVQIQDGPDQLGIFITGDSTGERLAGMTLVVFGGSDAIVANIMGDLDLNQMLKLSSAIVGKYLDSEMLKALLAQSGLVLPPPPPPPAPSSTEPSQTVPEATAAPAGPAAPPTLRVAPTRPQTSSQSIAQPAEEVD